jgi:hypothetical protein
MSKEEYDLAVGMYQQYQKDVVIIGNAMNIYQVKTLQLLEKNFREKYTINPKWYQKLIGAFKNRKL